MNVQNILKRVLSTKQKGFIKELLKDNRRIKLFFKRKYKVYDKNRIKNDFLNLGINQGDSLLVHSSLSRIGPVEKGADTIIDCLLEVLDCPTKGTLLMPTFPNKILSKEYLQFNKVFDVLNTPSKMGLITEIFRKHNEVKRSLHPTHPVAAFGLLADYYIKDHFNQLIPFNENSPFYKLAIQNGKILLLGLKMSESLTNLHVLEDVVDNFKFPVYDKCIFETTVMDENGNSFKVKTKVHNPEFSLKRKCDDLLPLFKQNNIIREGTVGDAKCIVLDAKKMLDVMIDNYNRYGITMYTPKGS